MAVTGEAAKAVTGCGAADTDGAADGITLAAMLGAFARADATAGAAIAAVIVRCDAGVFGLVLDVDCDEADAFPLAVAAGVDTLVGVFLDFFDVVVCLPDFLSGSDDWAEITTPFPRSVAEFDPWVVPPTGVAPGSGLPCSEPLDGDGDPASFVWPPAGDPDVPPSVDDVLVSSGVAHATPGELATAIPTPKATASAPTRPT